jgi:membrane-bound serine protease (ClpP class)
MRALKSLLLAMVLLLASGAGTSERSIWLVDLEGAVGPATADLVIRSIEDATTAGAAAIIIRIDTPGGLDKAMRDIVKAILGAKIPVVTYVAPDGARAASAGTYIVYASHVAAMAPASNVGSSTPVSLTPTPAPNEQGGEPDGAVPSPDEAMSRKVVNDAVAYLQSLAELRGRNIEWAEKTVREGANLRASEALENNVIDLVATDLTALLEALDGTEVEVSGQVVVLATRDAAVEHVQTDWRHDILAIITDPAIAYALLLVGFYGLILEFYNPGMIFPAVLGGICLLLGAYGLQMLPINYVGLALILLGIGLMIAEVFSPSFGVLGIGGIVAFVIGSIMLIDTDLPSYQLPLSIIAGFAVSTAVLAFIAVGAAVRARRTRVVSGVEGMLGSQGEVIDDFVGTGRVWVFGENWEARCDVPLKKGDRVRIQAVNGLQLIVEPIGEEE